MNSTENTEILWQQFSTALRSFIISKVRNNDDADDILQNVFLKIHDNIGSLRDFSKIKPWIYQITRNLIIDHFRANKLQGHNGEQSDLAFDPDDSEGFMNEAIKDMTQMLNELDEDDCEAICLTELEGISQKKYAELKGLSYSGAKSRVQRARRLLKNMLLNCCHYQFDKYGTVYDIQSKCCCCNP